MVFSFSFPFPRAISLILGLAPLLLVFYAGSARGQWQSPDGSPDIYYDGDGKVGVGTSTPAEQLTVEGNLRLTAPGTSKYLRLRTDSGALDIQSAGEPLYFNNSGEDIYLMGDQVGVGTTAPAVDFDVNSVESRFNTGGDYVSIGKFSAIDPDGRGGGWAAISSEKVLRIAQRVEVWGANGNYYLDVRNRNGDVGAKITGNGRDTYFGTNGARVGVGTASPSEKLTVAGNLLAEEVIVKQQGQWPDRVFEESYDLPSLDKVSSFIEKKGHLPDVPSAEEVEKNGLRLGQMDATLLRKVEELTLYAIEQKKRADRHEARADSLARVVDTLRKQVRKGRRVRRQHERELDAMRHHLKQLRRRLEEFASESR